MQGTSIPASLYETLNFAKFRDESFEYAKHVYDGLSEGKDQVVPDNYIAKWTPIARERVILAAYRLAYAI